MRKAYILFGVIAYSLMGCNVGKKALTGEAVSLTKDQKDQIRVINTAQANTLAAAESAGAVEPLESKLDPGIPGNLEKIAKRLKLMKLLKDGGCAKTGQTIKETFDQPWFNSVKVGSGNCPMEMVERTEYTAKKEWKMSRTLVLKTQEMRDETGLEEMKIDGMLMSAGSTAGQSAFGSVTYKTFKVAGVGKVAAKIEVFPEQNNGGQVKLTLDTGVYTASGRIRWEGERVAFFANSDVVTVADFEDLFSSFQLREIMDRAKKMK